MGVCVRCQLTRPPHHIDSLAPKRFDAHFVEHVCGLMLDIRLLLPGDENTGRLVRVFLFFFPFPFPSPSG